MSALVRLAITKLRATVGITSLCSTRVYHEGEAPQGAAYPLCVVQKIDNIPVGALGGNTGVENERLQVTCVATSANAAWTLAEAVEDALDGWKDLTTTPKVNNTRCVLETNRYDPPFDESGTGAFLEFRDFSVWTGDS